MSDSEVMMSVRVPKDLKALVDADSRNNQAVVRSALWREFGGQRKSDIERERSEKQERKTIVKKEISSRKSELTQLNKEIEALSRRLDKQESANEAQLEQSLDVLENVPWEPDNPAIKTNADDLDMTPEELIAELEDYYAE